MNALKNVSVVLLSVGIASAGCTKTREARVARMDQPLQQRVEPVRHAGIYEAKWTATDRKALKPIAGSGRYVRQGETLGFERDDTGRLFALHQDTRLELTTAPRQAKYVVWYHKQTVPTQFGKEMREVGDGAGIAFQAVGTGGLIVGGVALWLWLESENADDCDETNSFTFHKSKHRKHH